MIVEPQSPQPGPHLSKRIARVAVSRKLLQIRWIFS